MPTQMRKAAAVSGKNLPTVLGALAEQLLARASAEVELVVCGGSALQALGLVQRTTRDVDVLALTQGVADNGEPLLITSEPLPPLLLEAARVVARDFSLPADWLNAGPADLLREGLPDGCAGRLHAVRYGERLVVHFIDRFDQICLKTYAAVNSGEQRHLADLRALQPSDDEMLAAARWTVTQDALDEFPDLVRDFLRKTGFPDVATRL
jgi:hypothetical protein